MIKLKYFPVNTLSIILAILLIVNIIAICPPGTTATSLAGPQPECVLT